MRRSLADDRSAGSDTIAPQLVEDERTTQPAGVDDLDLGRVTEAPVNGSSRIRLIDDTSRAKASLSTLSFRPKLWMTLATGTPVTGWRSLWANCNR